MATRQDPVPRLTVPDPPLADGDLLLRPPTTDDVPWMVRGCRDPEVPRWTTVPSPYADADARRFLEDRAVDWEQGTTATFAILLSGEGAGMIDLRHIGQAPEVGYWIGPWARRRGAASRALRLLVDWAFDELGLDRIELRTMPGNIGSEGVAAAAGFVRGELEPASCAQRGRHADTYRWSRSAPAG